MNQRPGNAWAHCVEKAATRYVVQYDDARGRALMGASQSQWLAVCELAIYIYSSSNSNQSSSGGDKGRCACEYHLSVIVEAVAKVALIPRGRWDRTKRRSIEREEVLGTTDRKQPATL